MHAGETLMKMPTIEIKRDTEYTFMPTSSMRIAAAIPDAPSMNIALAYSIEFTRPRTLSSTRVESRTEL